MSYYDEDVQSKKVVVAYIVGLLMGGLLVWVFSSPVPPDESVSGSGVSKRSSQDKAVTACINKEGVPIMSESGERLVDCLGI